MGCFYPLKGWRSRHLNASGKHSVTFSVGDAFLDLPVELACGQCAGCRLDRSKAWAIRCCHEASLHKENSFITLTYSDEYQPVSVKQVDFQLFMKRLRKSVLPKKIRFYSCGEYGSEGGRAHYHAIIFGYAFPDRYLFQVRKGIRLYRSPELERVWPYGFSTVGDVTFDSAAYVARYILKKINGVMAENHYKRVNYITGEVVNVTPEYTTMSRKPGIAHDWMRKFYSDVYTQDCVITPKGWKMRPPKYYDSIYDTIDSDRLDNLKIKRRVLGMRAKADNTFERRETKAYILDRKLELLPREL
jgi:hypothetical protein